MRITCPNCDTSYTVPADKIGAKGRSVRCARCGLRWHATAADDDASSDPWRDEDMPPRATKDAEPAAPARATPERFAAQPADRAPAEPERRARTEPDGMSGAVEPAPITAAGRVPDFAAVAAGAETPPPEIGADPAPDPTAAADGPAEEAQGWNALVPAAARTAARPDDDDAKGTVTAGAAAAPDAKADGPGDVESLAKRPSIRVKRPQKPRLRLPKLDYRATYTTAKPWIGLSLFGLAILLPLATIAMREAIVEAMPSMAGLYRAIGFEVNLRGLVFQKIETIRELESGQPVLVVEGEISNPTDSTRPLPSIRLALRGDDRQEIYAWSVDPKATSVSPGASVRFRTRLAAPPDDARDVQIRFTERRSRQAAHP